MAEIEEVLTFLRECRVCSARIALVQAGLVVVEDASHLDRLPIAKQGDVDWTTYRRVLGRGTGHTPTALEFLPLDRFQHEARSIRSPRPFFQGPYGSRMLPSWSVSLRLERRHRGETEPWEAIAEAFPDLEDRVVATIPHAPEDTDAVEEMVFATIGATVNDTAALLLSALAIGGKTQQAAAHALWSAVLRNPPVRWKRGGALQVLVA